MGNNFDNKAATWDDKPGRIKLAGTSWSIIQKHLKNQKAGAVLDYGCGTGLLGFHAAEIAEHVSFCDTSAGMLEQVKRKQEHFGVEHMDILLADFLKDPLPERKYDVIVSMLVIHHVPDIAALMKKFYAILNPGGQLFWIDLEKEDGNFHDDNSGVHHFGFTKEEIKNYLKEGGMQLKSYDSSLFIEREKEEGKKKYSLFVAGGEKA